MFITTANLLEPVAPAFRDRMEVIRLSGYTEEEKLVIAQKHLVPRQIEENGLKIGQIEFSENALRAMIAEYTREAGLRNLERAIASICRKVARQVADGRKRKLRVINSSLEGLPRTGAGDARGRARDRPGRRRDGARVDRDRRGRAVCRGHDDEGPPAG